MTMNRTASAPTPWVKALASSVEGECVEMRRLGAAVQVRDSKNPHGAVLSFAPGQFAAWLDGAGSGEYAYLTD